LAIIVFDQLRHGGQFRALAFKAPGECNALAMSASAEDVQIDRARGIAYLSYLDRRAQVEGKPVFGTVMLVDLNAPDPRPRPALVADPPNFRPHGMSLYRAGDGSLRLFVISHPPGAEHEVHIFEQGPTGAFALVETVRDPLLLRPNAIVATGQRQFYVANDSGARNGWQRAQEFLFRRGLSSVVYFDGERMRSVASGIKSAAGIGVSPDGSHLYVAETAGKRLRIYERVPATGDLTLRESIDLGSAPDNVNVNADGSVWVAAHAKVLALVRSFASADHVAPTQILRFDPRANGAARLQEIYVNGGEQISAGSVGAVYDKALLIGSITDRKLLRCRLP
ncbi:MAG: SMP-30/gluconolactonase/LRE family protein, partial [Gammaproteobacteria bacterium]|nr:SMP-30/gluconolactonase/LRE family protein [Gammaproteobacteria bacterium]